MKVFAFFKSNSSFLLLSLFILKQLIWSPGVADAVIALGLICLFAYDKYLDANKQEPANEEFKKEMAALRDNVKSNKDTLEALKLSASFRR